MLAWRLPTPTNRPARNRQFRTQTSSESGPMRLGFAEPAASPSAAPTRCDMGAIAANPDNLLARRCER